jgi:hypothetical protein
MDHMDDEQSVSIFSELDLDVLSVCISADEPVSVAEINAALNPRWKSDAGMTSLCSDWSGMHETCIEAEMI